MLQLDHPQRSAERPFVREGQIAVSGHRVANTRDDDVELESYKSEIPKALVFGFVKAPNLAQ